VSERVFGVETEYALSATDGRGARVNHGVLLDGLMRKARAELPHLPDEHGHGLFLQNGARFYVDCGGHPEMTTPECGNPWDVVRYVRAGEAILLDVATRHRPNGQTSIFRANVDYSGTGAAWGCHDSYMHRAPPHTLPAQLIPHLVSRVVYAGAGGFSNLSPGIEFLLSPRTAHTMTEVSRDSTGKRPIFHNKDEALCGHDYHRLHLIFGESLCSDLAVWLKVGATALVVAMCEAGLHPGDGVALQAPLTAMRAFASDPTLTATAATKQNQPLTAIAVQRHYLEQAETHAHAAWMPPWAPNVCRRWRAALDRLSSGWEGGARALDWAIKLGLYRERAQRRGFTWEALASWNRVARMLAEALARVSMPARPLTADLVSARNSPIAGDVARMARSLEAMGLDWSRFGAFLALRDELFEIDTRFGQLGEQGIFSCLDRDAVLSHRVDGAGDVAGAIAHPPAVGRARIRGRLVRELTGHGGRYHCDWQGIWDAQERKRLDLSDPFASDGDWKDWRLGTDVVLPPFLDGFDESIFARRGRRRGARPEGDTPEPTLDPIALNRTALAHRKRGRLDEAERLLRQAIEIEDGQVAGDSPKRPHRRNNLAMVLMRAGKLDEARAVNAAAWQLKAGQHDLTSGRILFVRIALEHLGGTRDASLYVGQLKVLLYAERLDCLGDIDTTWDIPDVLTMICEKLPGAEASLLVAVAEALNDRTYVATLERIDEWNGASGIPLEAAWPEEGGQRARG